MNKRKTDGSGNTQSKSYWHKKRRFKYYMRYCKYCDGIYQTKHKHSHNKCDECKTSGPAKPDAVGPEGPKCQTH